VIAGWSRDEKREAAKVMLQALAERRIGRRDQANNWIWRLAEFTREVHEEYAVQRWPETKRLLGLLVNSSGGAHARNARRLVHASRKQDRRLAAALLAAALAHTPEAAEVLNGARTRMARKPSALSRELLRNFPKRRARGNRRRRRGRAEDPSTAPVVDAAVGNGAPEDGPSADVVDEALALEGSELASGDGDIDGRLAALEAAEAKAAAADGSPETGHDDEDDGEDADEAPEIELELDAEDDDEHDVAPEAETAEP
jgi:hypothetical protein